MNQRLQQLLALSLLSAAGCALFRAEDHDLLSSQSALKPDQVAEFQDQLPVRNVVRLETSITSASAADKRIRTLVWEELDESGLMSPEDRRRLNQSGIRVGVSGGALPWALESLRRGEHSDLTTSQVTVAPGNTGSSSTAFGSHIAIPEGSSSMIELPTDGATLTIPAGEIAGMKHGRDLQDARCLIELTPVEHGHGWVVIRFLPQIHHGAVTTRYDITPGAPQMPVRQKIQPLYEQQFELKLHTNETVVIGHMEQDEWTVGRLLFQSESLTSRTERLISFQLTELEKVTGQKSLNISYSKY